MAGSGKTKSLSVSCRMDKILEEYILKIWKSRHRDIRRRTLCLSKFYRVDNSDKYEISGTGLGLPIAKHIVESHGGKISVKSDLDKGSTFSILLPFEKD